MFLLIYVLIYGEALSYIGNSAGRNYICSAIVMYNKNFLSDISSVSETNLCEHKDNAERHF